MVAANTVTPLQSCECKCEYGRKPKPCIVLSTGLNVRRTYCKTRRAQHTVCGWHQLQNVGAATAHVSCMSMSPGGAALCRSTSSASPGLVRARDLSISPSGVRGEARALRSMPVLRRSKADSRMCLYLRLRRVSTSKGVPVWRSRAKQSAKEIALFKANVRYGMELPPKCVSRNDLTTPGHPIGVLLMYVMCARRGYLHIRQSSKDSFCWAEFDL